jgi:HTH-type transcriptional regulator/antitoxin HigA
MEELLIPFIATHPGTVLSKELISRCITQRKFAEIIEMQPTMLNEIIRGKRPITASIALSQEKALEISAEFWIRFQYEPFFVFKRLKKRNLRG